MCKLYNALPATSSLAGSGGRWPIAMRCNAMLNRLALVDLSGVPDTRIHILDVRSSMWMHCELLAASQQCSFASGRWPTATATAMQCDAIQSYAQCNVMHSLHCSVNTTVQSNRSNCMESILLYHKLSNAKCGAQKHQKCVPGGSLRHVLSPLFVQLLGENLKQ